MNPLLSFSPAFNIVMQQMLKFFSNNFTTFSGCLRSKTKDPLNVCSYESLAFGIASRVNIACICVKRVNHALRRFPALGISHKFTRELAPVTCYYTDISSAIGLFVCVLFHLNDHM